MATTANTAPARRQRLPYLRALAIAAAMTSAVLVAPATAEAHDGGESRCVTKHEWRHVDRGMKKVRVHRIFDVRGKSAGTMWGDPTGIRLYRPCAWSGGSLPAPVWGLGIREEMIVTYSVPQRTNGQPARVLGKTYTNSEPWVTGREYRAAKRGMTQRRVQAIFDTKGQITLQGGMHPGQSRHYRMKRNSGAARRCVAIDWGHWNGAWRIQGKSRPFGPVGPQGTWRCR